MVGFAFRLAFGEDDTWGRVASAIAFVNFSLRVSSSVWVDGVSEMRLPLLVLYGLENNVIGSVRVRNISVLGYKADHARMLPLRGTAAGGVAMDDAVYALCSL